MFTIRISYNLIFQLAISNVYRMFTLNIEILIVISSFQIGISDVYVKLRIVYVEKMVES